MRKINYDGSVEEDIKDIKNLDKIKSIVGKSVLKSIILNIFAGIAFFAMSLVDITFVDNADLIASYIFIIGDIYLFIVRPTIIVKRIKQKYNEALDRLKHLASDVSCEKNIETNFMRRTEDESMIVDSIEVKYNCEDEEFDTMTDFYALDTKDKLVVLREYSAYLTNYRILKKQEEKHELYLLSEDELPNPLPVVRRLEVKNIEKN